MVLRYPRHVLQEAVEAPCAAEKRTVTFPHHVKQTEKVRVRKAAQDRSKNLFRTSGSVQPVVDNGYVHSSPNNISGSNLRMR